MLDKMNLFNGQIAVVTGASSGIGRAIALSLAEQGATVCLAARRFEALEEIAAHCQAVPRKLLPYKLDIARDKDVEEFTTRLQADVGHVDVLIHSAGIFSLGSVARASIADFESQFRTNVLGPYALTQALLPMLRVTHGQIVFINSTAGLVARENVSQYAATKHALKALADSLREEVNQEGIRVMSLYLGRTATPLQAKVRALEKQPYCADDLIQTCDITATVISALSLSRSAEITEIRMRPFTRPTA
jgi:NADP-dependent 3-hydroxy acid dehydrogenase YdfG